MRKTIRGQIVQELREDKEIKRWWKYRDSALHYSLKMNKKQNQNSTYH